MTEIQTKRKSKTKLAPQIEGPGTISKTKPRKDAYKEPGISSYIEQLRFEIAGESGKKRSRSGSFQNYLEKARSGDASAVLHVLRLIAKSISGEALRQNNGLIDPNIAEVLYDELCAIVEGKKGALLKMRIPAKRPVDEAGLKIKFWFVVKVLQRMDIGETKAAALEAERKRTPKILSDDNALYVYKQLNHLARRHLENKRTMGN